MQLTALGLLAKVARQMQTGDMTSQHGKLAWHIDYYYTLCFAADKETPLTSILATKLWRLRTWNLQHYMIFLGSFVVLRD